MTLCYLALGSNLRTPTRQIHQAMHLLKSLPHTTIKKKSQSLISKPCGMRSQPLYCNAVVLIDTKLPPHTLLRYCQTIERHKGRIRKKRWGSRTLDIDLVLYGTQVIKTPTLTIPHPRLCERDFVLVPLLNISPKATLPNRRSLAAVLHDLKTRYVF